MLLGVWVKNFKSFSDEVEMDYLTTKQTSRLSDNLFINDNLRVTKASCLYGPNNVGKSNFIEAIEIIIKSMAGKADPSLFKCNTPLEKEGNKICEFGIAFTFGEDSYAFEFHYNTEKEGEIPQGFIYEKFQKLKIGEKQTIEEKLREGTLIYEKDYQDVKVGIKEDRNAIKQLIKNASYNGISIMSMNDNYEEIKKWKAIFKKLTDNVIILKTYESKKDDFVDLYIKNVEDREQITDLLKEADVDIKDYQYVKPDKIIVNGKEIDVKEDSHLYDELSLLSFHTGFSAPSYFIDSRGTFQTGLLGELIIDALKNDKTLVVDEIDNGLHFKITKALVNMFNNDTNYMGQIIFSTHDTNLLNTKSMFRKDQIWFLHVEDGKRYLYSLNDFGSKKTGTREDTDIERRYKNGYYGAMPDPSLIGVMLDIKENKENVH